MAICLTMKQYMLKENIKDVVAKMMKKEREHSAVITSRLINTAILHQKAFLPYKNFCEGMRDVVVCGAGPSLNNYVPIEGAIHIALNRAFIYDKVDFDFIFAQDYDGIRMVENELVDYRRGECVKFLGTQGNSKKSIPESLIIRCGAHKFDTDWYIPGSGTGGELVVDIDARPICNMYNVGQSVMQLALYMNPRRIYLAGCDMSGNHFAPGNQTAEEVEAQGREIALEWERYHDGLLRRWQEIKTFAEVHYPDTEIISVNPVGLKGMFTDLYQ